MTNADAQSNPLTQADWAALWQSILARHADRQNFLSWRERRGLQEQMGDFLDDAQRMIESVNAAHAVDYRALLEAVTGWTPPADAPDLNAVLDAAVAFVEEKARACNGEVAGQVIVNFLRAQKREGRTIRSAYPKPDRSIVTMMTTNAQSNAFRTAKKWLAARPVCDDHPGPPGGARSWPAALVGALYSALTVPWPSGKVTRRPTFFDHSPQPNVWDSPEQGYDRSLPSLLACFANRNLKSVLGWRLNTAVGGSA